MKLHANTWHHRLATEYGRGDFGSKTDLCTYARHFCMGIFFCCAFIMLSVLIGYFFILDPLVWVAVCIAQGRLMPMEDQTVAVLILWTVAIGLVLFAWWATYRDEHGKAILPIPQLVRDAYRGWKEKYCPVVWLA